MKNGLPVISKLAYNIGRNLNFMWAMRMMVSNFNYGESEGNNRT
ncbi:MAG: hypothetical protein ABR566_01415 [Pyrinomonadaceae bacterium]